MAKTKKENPDVSPMHIDEDIDPLKFATANTQLGDMVAFYEEGDAAQEPIIAIVTKITPTGLQLHTLVQRGMLVRESVRHVLDPWYEETNDRKRARRERGAWDLLGNARQRLRDEAEKRRQDMLRRQRAEEDNRQSIADAEPLTEEDAMKAAQWAIEGVPMDEMAVRLGRGVTVGRLKSHFDMNPVSA